MTNRNQTVKQESIKTANLNFQKENKSELIQFNDSFENLLTIGVKVENIYATF